ncbi:MAG: CBS domain-containing protein [Candidatus Saccharimonas sp.]
MMIISFSIVVLLAFILLGVAAVTPRRPTLSMYELQRRRKEGSQSAADELHRLSAIDDIVAVQRVIEVVIVVVLSFILVSQWHLLGMLGAIAVALFYRRIAHFELVRVNSQRVFDEYEAPLVRFIEKRPRIAKFIGGLAGEGAASGIGSRQELEHLVDESMGVLSIDEKKLLKSSLHFAEKTVEQVMTPRGVLEIVDAQEVLGPIVLDQLHKTGHSRFPVMRGDIDHIVGVLHIRELLMIREKTSQTAEQSMEKKVYYINQTQTLQHALAAFLSTRHHMFIVVNEYRETAGVVTLEDCIEALIGRKIVDEYDAHDDLRSVAERNAKHNNNTPGATNL